MICCLNLKNYIRTLKYFIKFFLYFARFFLINIIICTWLLRYISYFKRQRKRADNFILLYFSCKFFLFLFYS